MLKRFELGGFSTISIGILQLNRANRQTIDALSIHYNGFELKQEFHISQEGFISLENASSAFEQCAIEKRENVNK